MRILEESEEESFNCKVYFCNLLVLVLGFIKIEKWVFYDRNLKDSYRHLKAYSFRSNLIEDSQLIFNKIRLDDTLEKSYL